MEVYFMLSVLFSLEGKPTIFTQQTEPKHKYADGKNKHLPMIRIIFIQLNRKRLTGNIIQPHSHQAPKVKSMNK